MSGMRMFWCWLGSLICCLGLCGCTTAGMARQGDTDMLRIELQRLRANLAETTTTVTVLEKQLERQEERQDALIQDVHTMAAWQRALQDHVNRVLSTQYQPPTGGEE